MKIKNRKAIIKTIKSISIAILSCYFFSLTSCISAGTHGKIKGYIYPVVKDTLEKAILKVISNNPVIIRDTVYDDLNDIHKYIRVYVNSDNERTIYTLHFYGDTSYWRSSKTSEIAIVYAYDKNGKGGSQGNGGVTWYTPFLKKRLISLFENEFINKLDKELGYKHEDDN